jgi:hypothetical protein
VDCVLAVLVCCAAAAFASSPDWTQVDKILNAAIANITFPGCVARLWSVATR